MDAYDRCTNLGKKNLANSVAINGRGRELFRPPMYMCTNIQQEAAAISCPCDRQQFPLIYKHVQDYMALCHRSQLSLNSLQ